MDMLLTALGFAFSFFLVFLSYWKEDRLLNSLGTFSLIAMSVILVASTIQTTTMELTATHSVSNATGNYTNYSYEPKMHNNGLHQEGIVLGFVMGFFTIIQYLYFSIAYKNAEREV